MSRMNYCVSRAIACRVALNNGTDTRPRPSNAKPRSNWSMWETPAGGGDPSWGWHTDSSTRLVDADLLEVIHWHFRTLTNTRLVPQCPNPHLGRLSLREDMIHYIIQYNIPIYI